MQRHLKDKDVEVQFLFSGRARGDYFDMEQFGDWWDRSGLTFVTHRGKIRPLKTLAKNNVAQLIRDIFTLDLSQYDLVLCDYEPITAWAAKRQGVDCIGLGHQYAFNFPVPVEGDSGITRTIMRQFAPTSSSLGLHWHHFDQPILPPIIDIDRQHKATNKGHILVYLGFESPEDVIPLLKQFPQQKFIYYGHFDAPSFDGNVLLRPLSVVGFKEDLHSAEGVICNAGFELASEALQLGKKILVKPLQGQLEQLSNAKALIQLGLGMRMNHLDPAIVQQWLDHAPIPQCNYPDVAKAIADWVVDPNRCSREQLVKDLWMRSSVSNASGHAAHLMQAAV